MISVVLRICGGSSCVFIFNLMELTSCLDLPHVDRYAPLKYFCSSSMFDFKVKLSDVYISSTFLKWRTKVEKWCVTYWHLHSSQFHAACTTLTNYELHRLLIRSLIALVLLQLTSMSLRCLMSFVRKGILQRSVRGTGSSLSSRAWRRTRRLVTAGL